MKRNRATLGALVAATLLPLGCVSTPVDPEPEVVYRVEKDPPPSASATAPSRDTAMPELPVSQVDQHREARPRIDVLEPSDQDMRAILRELADQYGLNLQIAPGVRGRVTTRLRDATLSDALDAVVVQQGYSYDLDDNTLRVEPARLQSELFELDFIALSRIGIGTTIIQRRFGTGAGQRQGTQTGAGGAANAAGGTGAGADVIRTVEVTDLWEDIRVSLEALLFSEARSAREAGLEQTTATGVTGGAGGRAPQATSRTDSEGRRLIVNPMAGTALVTASPRVLEEVTVYLETIEAAVQRQVRIEAKFVEVTLDRERTYGIDWHGLQRFGDFSISAAPSGTGGVEFTLSGPGDSEVNAVLEALDTQGDVRVLSSPSTSTLNNQRAIFNVTTNEIFFALTQQPVIGAGGQVVGFDSQVETQTIAVGIIMDVIPQISDDNTITMNVRPRVSTLLRVEEFEQNGAVARAPITSDRELDTVVRVRSGETHVIGGLIETRTEDVRTGIPLLMDIPWLGRLFSRTRQVEKRTELVIFITPTVIAGAAPALP